MTGQRACGRRPRVVAERLFLDTSLQWRLRTVHWKERQKSRRLRHRCSKPTCAPRDQALMARGWPLLLALIPARDGRSDELGSNAVAGETVWGGLPHPRCGWRAWTGDGGRRYRYRIPRGQRVSGDKRPMAWNCVNGIPPSDLRTLDKVPSWMRRSGPGDPALRPQSNTTGDAAALLAGGSRIAGALLHG